MKKVFVATPQVGMIKFLKRELKNEDIKLSFIIPTNEIISLTDKREIEKQGIRYCFLQDATKHVDENSILFIDIISEIGEKEWKDFHSQYQEELEKIIPNCSKIGFGVKKNQLKQTREVFNLANLIKKASTKNINLFYYENFGIFSEEITK